MGENIISDNMGRKFSLCFPVPKKKTHKFSVVQSQFIKRFQFVYKPTLDNSIIFQFHKLDNFPNITVPPKTNKHNRQTNKQTNQSKATLLCQFLCLCSQKLNKTKLCSLLPVKPPTLLHAK